MLSKYLFIIIVLIAFDYYYSYSQTEKEISLQKVLDYTLSNSPVIRKNESELEKSKTDLKQVEAMKILPITTLDFRTGIVPGAKGNVFYSPTDKFDLERWGPFFQTEIDIVQPIYTFGRFSNAEKGAIELISIQESKNKSSTNELCLNVVQCYWSLIATAKAVKIASDLKIAFDSLITLVQKEIAKEGSDLDQSYLFEVKSNEYIISTLYLNSLSNKFLVQKTFDELVGLKIDSLTEFIDKVSPVFDVSDQALDNAISYTLSNHNDILMIESGLKAIDNKIDFQNSSKYPLLFLAGGLQYGYASARDRQNNPFVYDNFNYLNLGGFLGVKWDFNFRPVTIEQEQWESEKTSMNENLKLLTSKIKIEVTKAFLDVKNNYEELKDVRISLGSAQSWSEMSFDNWSMGFGQPERLIRAMSTYFQLKAKEVEQEYNYNISLAKLANSIGNFTNYLNWIKNGKITF